MIALCGMLIIVAIPLFTLSRSQHVPTHVPHAQWKAVHASKLQHDFVGLERQR
jgi:hypothetical protein